MKLYLSPFLYACLSLVRIERVLSVVQVLSMKWNLNLFTWKGNSIAQLPNTSVVFVFYLFFSSFRFPIATSHFQDRKFRGLSNRDVLNNPSLPLKKYVMVQPKYYNKNNSVYAMHRYWQELIHTKAGSQLQNKTKQTWRICVEYKPYRALTLSK